MTTLRIALVGLGAAARTIHVPAIRKLEGFELVAGCDPVADAAAFAFPVHRSLKELLTRHRPDVLTIATPPDAHFDTAMAGLEAGCHLFVEKPLAATLDEADALLARARALDRRIAVNHEFRTMRCHTAAAAALGTPGFGRLLFLSMQQTFRVTEASEAGWRGRVKRRTLMDFGPHVFDLARFFMEGEPVSLRGRTPRPRDPDGADHLAIVDLLFPGERCAQITLDRLTRGRHRYLDCRLDGEEATVETSIGGRLEVRAGIRAATRHPFVAFERTMGAEARLWRGEHNRVIARDPLDLFAAATAVLLRRFRHALIEGGPVPCSGEDGRQALALVQATYESAETDREIDLRCR